MDEYVREGVEREREGVVAWVSIYVSGGGG